MLGLVLGPVLERSLLQALTIGRGDLRELWSSPPAAVMLAAAARGARGAGGRRPRPPIRARMIARELLAARPLVFAQSMVVTTVGFLAPLLLVMAEDLEVSAARIGQLVVLTSVPWALGRRCGDCSATGSADDRSSSWRCSAWPPARSPAPSRPGTGCWRPCGCSPAASAAAALPTILAGLVDHYPAAQRARMIGWTTTSFSFAALLGVPAVGAVGGVWGWRAAFVVTGLGLVVAALFVWLAYPRAAPQISAGETPWQAYRYLFGRPHLTTLLLSNLCERVTFMVVTLYLASFLIQRYGLDPVTVAPALFLIAVGALIGAVGGGFVADRFDRVGLASVMLVLSGLSASRRSCGRRTWPSRSGPASASACPTRPAGHRSSRSCSASASSIVARSTG